MGVEAAALERLLARNAQVATEEILAQVMAETDAAHAVLFVERQRRLCLHGGVSVDQACLDRANAAWRTSARVLLAGRVCWHESWCLWPCAAQDGLVLLYLAGVELERGRVQATVEGLARLLVMLATEASQGPETPSPPSILDEYLRHATTEAIERRRLTMLLHDSEWNISRVARARGVTRVTLYRWMRRLGIERLKPRRSPKMGQPGMRTA